MRIHRTVQTLSIELPLAEALVLLDELSHVRGGARLPKLKQVCHELEMALTLEAQRRPERSRKNSRPLVVLKR
jgi:hypothetical protein